MRIKFLASVDAGYSHYRAGKTYEVADEKAARFIEAGNAKKVVARKKRKKSKKEGDED